MSMPDGTVMTRSGATPSVSTTDRPACSLGVTTTRAARADRGSIERR
jgi:hypothetical protein